MIIDQLPVLASVQGTDEVPIERGTTTYKTDVAALLKSATDAAETAQSTANAVADSVANTALYFSGVPVSASSGDIATVSFSAITVDHVVVECTFSNPSYITTDVTWTTAAGSLVLNGTCTSATTANIVLVKKNN